MSRLLKLRRRPQCFYCQHVLENTPEDIHNFTCPACASHNIYDRKTGEILSSEPAMYDPNDQANMASFSRKATPSKNAIPSGVEQSIFCRECSVNQTLVTSMLANYLPLPSDPNYQALLATLPEYKASLETRYPLVCENCLPLVEDKLQKKEHMARSKALGGWLNANQSTPRRPGMPSRNLNSSIVRQTREKPWQSRLWMVQGFMYFATTAWVMSAYYFGMSRARSPPLRPPNPALVVGSLVWSFWNQSWLQVRRAQGRGQALRAVGRKESMRVQFAIWISRLIMSVLVSFWGRKITEGTFGAFLAVELVLGILVFSTLKVVEPPPIALSRHSSVSIQKTPLKPRRSSLMPSQPLTTSMNKPTNVVPAFGAPSLISRLSGAGTSANNGDEMDWAPQASRLPPEENPFLPKPGRLSVDPTGLENLLAGTSLATGLGEDDLSGRVTRKAARNSVKGSRDNDLDILTWIHQQDLLVMGGVIVTITILLIAAILPAWKSPKIAPWDPSWEWTQTKSDPISTTLSQSQPWEGWSEGDDA